MVTALMEKSHFRYVYSLVFVGTESTLPWQSFWYNSGLLLTCQISEIYLCWSWQGQISKLIRFHPNVNNGTGSNENCNIMINLWKNASNFKIISCWTCQVQFLKIMIDTQYLIRNSNWTMGERSIFQTYWKAYCFTKSLFFELESPNSGYLIIF